MALGGALEWDRLPDLPDREGFAGVFSCLLYTSDAADE